MGGTHVDGGVGSWSQEACASCKGYPDQGECSCPPEVLARRVKRATPDHLCRCFERQAWCDCEAGRRIKAEHRRVSRGSRAELLAFLRGTSDFWKAGRR